MTSANFFPATIPLVIDGQDYQSSRQCSVPDRADEIVFHGADTEACIAAVASSERAFASWSQTAPLERRKLFHRLAEV